MIAQVRPIKQRVGEEVSGWAIPIAWWTNLPIFMIFLFYFNGSKILCLGWFKILNWVIMECKNLLLGYKIFWKPNISDVNWNLKDSVPEIISQRLILVHIRK